MIKLALVDDEALFRKGLKLLIQDMDGVEVVMEASDGEAFLRLLESYENKALPDLAMLDLNMPKIDGIETSKILKERFPNIHIVILSTHFKKAFVLFMLELGVSSYIPKDINPDEFETTIREVYELGFYYPPKVLNIINQNFMSKVKNPKSISFAPQLTSRELEVLALICNQYTTAEIGKKLFISARTVEGHRNNLLGKLGARNTAGLVAYAVQNGLVKITSQPKFK